MSAYSVDDYGEMIDSARTDAYAEALRRVVRPGAVVLDIGTGAGILALLACRSGAARVHAVEPAAIVQLARELAQANGMADRIVFHQCPVEQLRLAEPVDVIVADIHGVMPLHDASPAAIFAARDQFLKPGGAVIPRRDAIRVALVEAPELARPVLAPWLENRFGLDLSAGSVLASHRAVRAKVTAAQMLSAPADCGTIDYEQGHSAHFTARVELEATRAGTAHGLCGWFDSVLAEGVGFSNAPGDDELPYGRLMFRWPRPVDVDAGDVVAARLRAQHVQGRHVWAWDCTVLAQGQRGREIARFRQSTFQGEPLTPEALAAVADDHVAELGDEAGIDALMLQRMGERLPLGEVAREAAERFPARFPTWQHALERAGALCARYRKPHTP